ncbi:MAG TPA: glycosyl transferase family 2 [Cyanobacteria bacterium UBA11369]|nr:glycosyl transferase family 2 [Cyanobacteria bacterium UBA11371]HBE35504.1 glycosyl transferase family 2 [Cyanobacteria bacterium UBA11368]HBE47236.1 glycosyl transferase family 2 [Cyanobacteria bacterium UBA11369]
MGAVGLGLTSLSLGIWIGLLCFRGQFWRCDQRLENGRGESPQLKGEEYPSVCAVIPARNEAEMLPMTLRSLLTQSYPGEFSIVLVDDHSTDGTAEFAQGMAEALLKRDRLQVIAAAPLPSGWTGKLWAMAQGIEKAETLTRLPDYFLLTDADIEHDVNNLNRLVAKAQEDDLDLVSLMVLLRCQSFWEKLLIPAFVFFFQKLYPFRWVNNPKYSTAAAAGGCILIRREALSRIGGIETLRDALIDDCTLGQAVKSTSKNGIWLGLSQRTRSKRAYDSLTTIWDMVARTAFTQLNYSPWLLVGTLIAMTLVYIVPPVGGILAGLTGNWLVAIAGFTTWLLMAIAYLPTIRLYRCSRWLAFALPAIAFLYTLMTIDSARRHWQGKGGAWKGRVYPAA